MLHTCILVNNKSVSVTAVCCFVCACLTFVNQLLEHLTFQFLLAFLCASIHNTNLNTSNLITNHEL